MSLTIKELATITGLSRGTFDRVINNRPGVSEESYKIAIEAISKYGYTPNKMGKALAARKKQISVGVIVNSMHSDPYFADVCKGVEMAYQKVKDSGFKVIFKESGDARLEKELDALKSVVNDGVSAIAFAPMNVDDIAAEINKITDKGISIITYGTDIADTSRLCFIGHDNIKSGRTSAQMLSGFIGGEGKVAIVGGLQNFQCHAERVRGIESYIHEKCPNIEIVDVFDTMNEEFTSYLLVKKLLENNPDLKGLFIISRGINGVVDAIKEANFQGKLKIGSFDLPPEVIKYLNEDIITFSIDQKPSIFGEKIVNIFYDYLVNGVLPETDRILTSTQIVVKESLSN